MPFIFAACPFVPLVARCEWLETRGASSEEENEEWSLAIAERVGCVGGYSSLSPTRRCVQRVCGEEQRRGERRKRRKKQAWN